MTITLADIFVAPQSARLRAALTRRAARFIPSDPDAALGALYVALASTVYNPARLPGYDVWRIGCDAMRAEARRTLRRSSVWHALAVDENGDSAVPVPSVRTSPDLRLALRRSLATMGRDERRIVMRLADGWATREIAADLGLSQSKVSRTVRALRQTLDA